MAAAQLLGPMGEFPSMVRPGFCTQVTSSCESSISGPGDGLGTERFWTSTGDKVRARLDCTAYAYSELPVDGDMTTGLLRSDCLNSS